MHLVHWQPEAVLLAKHDPIYKTCFYQTPGLLAAPWNFGGLPCRHTLAEWARSCTNGLRKDWCIHIWPQMGGADLFGDRNGRRKLPASIWSNSQVIWTRFEHVASILVRHPLCKTSKAATHPRHVQNRRKLKGRHPHTLYLMYQSRSHLMSHLSARNTCGCPSIPLA